MTLVALNGDGIWFPTMIAGFANTNSIAVFDSVLLDADEEEGQFIGSIHIDGGGSKTFGTSGSKIDWLPGASITFAATSTCTVGVKKAASIDTTNGQPPRATIGAAAFDVYKGLVGGTDTITSATWRSDSMASGTPFTVADGDLIAVCFHLDVTSGSPSIKVRSGTLSNALHSTSCTLVTSGPTYTIEAAAPNLILTFDDGTLGWLEPTYCFSVVDAVSSNIGNGNINANIVRVPFSCKIDAIAAVINPSSTSADFALELYSTPLGTPSLVESVTQDGAITATNASRLVVRRLTTPRTLTIGTDYAVGVKQTSATALTVLQQDVNTATFLKTGGAGTETYAAISTGAATFAQQNSGKRRYKIWMRMSHLDDGTTTAGGLMRHPGMIGGLSG